jgi:hypothetical protein
MCFAHACQPACTTDAQCGKGFGCSAGACAPLAGKPVGAACTADSDCSSRTCESVSKTCQIACAAESDCPTGQTCFVNPVDTTGAGATDAIHPICIPRRAAAAGAPGAACTADAGCVQGSCLLGVCATLCAGACATDLGCFQAAVLLDDGTPTVKACLPSQGVLDLDLGRDAAGPLALPEHAVSLALTFAAPNEDPSYFVGPAVIADPSNATLFDVNADFYMNPLRFQPSEGSSTMLVSNSPLVKLVPLGAGYTWNPFAQTMSGVSGHANVHARIKLRASALDTGKMTVHVFLTALAGGCLRNPPDAAAARSGWFGPFESKLKQVFAQAGITIDGFQYADSTAPSSVTLTANGAPSPELDDLLKAATAADAPGALELVIVRSLNAPGGNGVVLGIAGGIPASPGVPGTLHSGAAVSLSTLCSDTSQVSFALTAAHELSHTLGLFHSQEQDGHTDQFTDEGSRTENLMFWQEGSGASQLSPGQTTALRANPMVH